MPQWEQVRLFLQNCLLPLQVWHQPNVPITLVFLQVIHQLFEVLYWAQAGFVQHKFKGVSERCRTSHSQLCGKDRREKGSSGHTRWRGSTNSVSHCLPAESLPVSLSVLLAHPHVKHISLNTSHSPPTLPHCLIMDSAKYLNPAQLLRPGDNENRLFSPVNTADWRQLLWRRKKNLHTTGFTAWSHRQYLCKKTPQINWNYMGLTKHCWSDTSLCKFLISGNSILLPECF